MHNYDPKRDADKDIRAAAAEAKLTGKRVLVEVGGDWCKWCHIMDGFYKQNPALLDLREKNYVLRLYESAGTPVTLGNSSVLTVDLKAIPGN